MNDRTAARRASKLRRANGHASPRFGVALAGGGPLGAIYEIGALAALADVVDGFDFNDADLYVGVSAGSFIAAGLANGFTPHQMARIFVDGENAADRFDPEILLRPARAEFRARLAALPSLLAQALLDYATRRRSLPAALERLGRALPTGLFDGAAIDTYLSHVFASAGRTNDFRELTRTLLLVATDLDTGETVAFGSEGHDDIPVSRAVQASCALPGLYPPVEIDGRYFVDGVLRKTLHASLALERGVELLVCLNPLVPYDARPAQRARAREHRLGNLVEGGLPVVLTQTFRSIIHSRLDAGMERYRTHYPGADVILFHPQRADADIFFSNPFSYANRRRLCEHAYQKTRQDLLVRYDELAPKFARHGVTIKRDVAADPQLTLVRPAALEYEAWIGSQVAAATHRLGSTLDNLERRLRVAGAPRS
jgi:predicted acylesterase/phospholipase RssA